MISIANKTITFQVQSTKSDIGSWIKLLTQASDKEIKVTNLKEGNYKIIIRADEVKE